MSENWFFLEANGAEAGTILYVAIQPQCDEAINKITAKDPALPVFWADMPLNEIEELTESSIEKLFGEGQVSVETSGLRPHRFHDLQGFLFDMDIATSEGPGYGGIAGALVYDNKLYLIAFLGVRPYYFDRYKDEALAIIQGTKIRLMMDAGVSLPTAICSA